MSLELWFNSQRMELKAGEKISYTLQVNDIADVKDRQASYTNLFALPKTANNIQAFKGLGVTSDTSNIPYTKNECQLKYGGFDVVRKGWMQVSETAEAYKVHVYSGIVNFFKAIDNKTIGGDLDLIEINHVKNIDTVGNSPFHPFYRYHIADYNGLTHVGESVINVDYLIPSVKVSYLWDKIHQAFGFTYSGDIFQEDDFQDLWLSYPKYVDALGSLKEVFRGNIGALQSNVFDVVDKKYFYPEYSEVQKIEPGYNIISYGNDVYYPNKAGNFQFGESGSFLVRLTGSVTYSKNSRFSIRFVRQRGKPNVTFEAAPSIRPDYTGDTFTLDESIVFENVSAGEYLNFVILIYNNNGVTVNMPSSITMTVSKINTEEISFSEGFKGLQIKNFTKSILNRFGLTMFFNEDSNHVEYRQIPERLDFSKAIDWTEKYIKRTNERYVFSTYAQQNTFKFKYDNDDEASYNDGVITIPNANLDDEKTAYECFTYSPELEPAEFNIGGFSYKLPVFKMYEKKRKRKVRRLCGRRL